MSRLTRVIVPLFLTGATVLACYDSEVGTAPTGDETSILAYVPAGTPHKDRPSLASGSAAEAGTTTIGFEGYVSGTELLESAYASQGVAITGAVVYTFPRYNWSDYPAHTGLSVISALYPDANGTTATINVSFTDVYGQVGVYVTAREPVTLACKNAAGTIVGSAAAHTPNLDERPPYSVYPPNDYVEVKAIGIKSCAVTGTLNFFVIDDLTLKKGNTTTPKFTKPTHAVAPVLWQVFDARAGTARRSTDSTAPEQLRSDTVSLVLAIDTALGAVPKDTFWLETTVRPGSGYHMHDHGTRPRGRLWLPSAAAHAAKGPGGDSVMQVVMPDSGKARLIFRSSGVSGIEVIRLHRDSPTGPVLDSTVVTVRVTGLERMTRDVPLLYYFKDQDTTVTGQGHGNFNDAAVPAFRDSVVRAFHKYLDAGNDFLQGEDRFVITEASLPWGGLLDISDPAAEAWRWPHFTHRTGTDMDVRTHNPGSLPALQREVMDRRRRAAFKQACDSVVNCNYETPNDTPARPYHFHLKPGPTIQ